MKLTTLILLLGLQAPLAEMPPATLLSLGFRQHWTGSQAYVRHQNSNDLGLIRATVFFDDDGLKRVSVEFMQCIVAESFGWPPEECIPIEDQSVPRVYSCSTNSEIVLVALCNELGFVFAPGSASADLDLSSFCRSLPL